MSGWRLRWRAGPGGPPLDLSPLNPGRLAGLEEREVAAIRLLYGNRRLPLGELFELAALPDPDRLVVDGATDRFDRVAQELAGGRIVVEGDVGELLAFDMRGGEVEVTGRAGTYAACQLAGGIVRVAGDAGQFAGAALPGARHGMDGGWLLVGGDLGARAGDRMRRGVIAARGSAGPYLGARMIAGTIVMGGACADGVGYGMKRGSLVLAQPPAAMLATFQDHGAHELGWLRLLRRELEGVGFQPGAIGLRRQRWSGCLSAGGLGEVLVAA